MIVAHALIRVRDGQAVAFEEAAKRALPLMASVPGFRGMEVLPAMEAAGFYLMRMLWTDIASHRDGFRKSTLYTEMMALIGPFIEQLPEISYFGPSIIDSPGCA